LLVVLGVLALGGYWNYREGLRRQIDEAAAALDSEDPGWRFEQLESGRAEVRPSENSALVVAAARRHLPRDWPPKELWDVEPILEVSPNHRHPDEYLRAVEKELAAVPAALTAARTLVERDKGRFPIVYGSNPWAILLPHVPEARVVAALLRYDALLRMHRGDGRGALESARAAVNAGRSLGDEPFAISQLVRTACVAIGVGLAERTLALTTAPEAELKAMQQLLEKEERFPTFLVVARSERAALHQTLNQLVAGELPLTSFRNDSKESWRDRWLFFLEQDRLRRYHLAVLPMLTRQVEVGQLPPHEWRAAQEKLNQEFKDIIPPDYDGLMASGMRMGQAFRRGRAWLRCAVVGLAVERHRVAKGSWPASLAEVEKRVPAEVLTDAMDGKPLRYRRLADGVAVYSVGSDGTDDGGSREPGRHDAPGSDLVFRLWDVKERNKPPVPKPPEPEEVPGGPPEP
jgi:hypothetical protein